MAEEPKAKGRPAKQFPGKSGKVYTGADFGAASDEEKDAILADLEKEHHAGIKRGGRNWKSAQSRTPEEEKERQGAAKQRESRAAEKSAKEKETLGKVIGQGAAPDVDPGAPAAETPASVGPVPDVGVPDPTVFIANVGTEKGWLGTSAPASMSLAVAGSMPGSLSHLAVPQPDGSVTVTQVSRPSGGGGAKQALTPVEGVEPENMTWQQWMRLNNTRGGVDKTATAAENKENELREAVDALQSSITAGSEDLPKALQALRIFPDDPDVGKYIYQLAKAQPEIAQAITDWHGIRDLNTGEVIKSGHGTTQADLERRIHGDTPYIKTVMKTQTWPRESPLHKLPVLVHPPDAVDEKGNNIGGNIIDYTGAEDPTAWHESMVEQGAVPLKLEHTQGAVFESLLSQVESARKAANVERDVGKPGYEAGLIAMEGQHYVYGRQAGPEDHATNALMAASNASAFSLLNHLASPTERQSMQDRGVDPDEPLHKHLDALERATGQTLSSEVGPAEHLSDDADIAGRAHSDVDNHPLYAQMLAETEAAKSGNHEAAGPPLVEQLAAKIPGVDLSAVTQGSDLVRQLRQSHEARLEEYKKLPWAAELGDKAIRTPERAAVAQAVRAGEVDDRTREAREQWEEHARRPRSEDEDEQEVKLAEPEEVSYSEHVPAARGEEAEQEEAESKSQEEREDLLAAKREKALDVDISSDVPTKSLSEDTKTAAVSGAQAVRHAALRERRAQIFRDWSQLSHVRSKLNFSGTLFDADKAAPAMPTESGVEPREAKPEPVYLGAEHPGVKKAKAERLLQGQVRSTDSGLGYAQSILDGEHLHSNPGIRHRSDSARALMKLDHGWAPDVRDFEESLHASRQMGISMHTVHQMDIPWHVNLVPHEHRAAALLAHWHSQKQAEDSKAPRAEGTDAVDRGALDEEREALSPPGKTTPGMTAEEYHRASAFPDWVDTSRPVQLTANGQPTGNLDPMERLTPEALETRARQNSALTVEDVRKAHPTAGDKQVINIHAKAIEHIHLLPENLANHPEHAGKSEDELQQASSQGFKEASDSALASYAESHQLNPTEAVPYVNPTPKQIKERGTIRVPAATPYTAENPMGERLSMSQIGPPMPKAEPVPKPPEILGAYPEGHPLAGMQTPEAREQIAANKREIAGRVPAASNYAAPGMPSTMEATVPVSGAGQQAAEMIRSAAAVHVFGRMRQGGRPMTSGRQLAGTTPSLPVDLPAVGAALVDALRGARRRRNVPPRTKSGVPIPTASTPVPYAQVTNQAGERFGYGIGVERTAQNIAGGTPRLPEAVDPTNLPAPTEVKTLKERGYVRPPDVREPRQVGRVVSPLRRGNVVMEGLNIPGRVARFAGEPVSHAAGHFGPDLPEGGLRIHRLDTSAPDLIHGAPEPAATPTITRPRQRIGTIFEPGRTPVATVSREDEPAGAGMGTSRPPVLEIRTRSRKEG